VYVDEAVAGNDAVVRAAEFDKTVGADAIRAHQGRHGLPGRGCDLDCPYNRKTPALLGTGQAYEDIMPFDPDAVVEELLGS